MHSHMRHVVVGVILLGSRNVGVCKLDAVTLLGRGYTVVLCRSVGEVQAGSSSPL
jgi:hypothetical protein